MSGTTGRTGGYASDELLRLGKRVRAYVRSYGEKAAAPRKQGVEIAIGDLAIISAALAGIKGA